jgi:hypothetical protein
MKRADVQTTELMPTVPRRAVDDPSRRTQASSRKPSATVIRSLQRGAVALDATGRRVVNPRSGVFFVREPLAAGGKPSAVPVRKVVIQR